MENRPGLTGQIAAITGASGDIGRAIAKALTAAGARVAMSDLRERTGAESDDSPGSGRHFWQVDTTDGPGIDRWLESIADQLGEPTIAVVNAAIVTPKSLREMSAEEWRREIDVNLTGSFLFANAAARRMAAHGIDGKIIIIGSWAADRPHPHVPAYSVAKAGLRMLCRLIASEYARDGIQAIEIAPGYVEAGLSAQVFRKDPERAQKARERVPLKRLIRPEEVAHLVHLICLPENRHMTGCTVTCDGGLSL